MSAVRLTAAVLACLVCATVCGAQPPTGSITGQVTGDSGNKLANVVVTVQNQITGVRTTATTDSDGRYTIAKLPVDGDYQVQVTLTGFASPAGESVTLVADAILVVNFRLKLSVTETVAVSAASPTRGAGRSTLQQIVSEPLVRTVPLFGRNFIPLASLTAGFTGNPNFPNPLGQEYWTNNVLVDGASHFSKWRSAPRTFYSGYPLEAIKEVQVLTSRFSAEYGDALASVTTAVTKSGTDQYHGAGLFFFQNDHLNAIPEFALEKPPGNSQQYGFTIGGPLFGDQNHFFESYEGRRSRSQNIVVSSDEELNGAHAPDNQDEHLIFLRLDRRQSDQHQFMARYNGQFFRWHNEPGGLMLPGSGTEYKNDVHTILTTDRHEFSTRLLSEARLQFARFVDDRQDLQPSVFISRAGYSQEGGQLGPFGFGADPEDTWEGANTLTFASGPQTLKFGGGAKYVRAHNASLTYGRGAYFFAGGPDLFPQPYAFIQGVAPTSDAAVADPRSLSAFGFVQDDWRPRQGLTFNLGVRYDIERISNVRNYAVPVDKNNVQPRAGAAWAPFANGRTTFRGGAGLYTQQQLLYYINRVQLEGPDGAVTLSLSPDSPFFPRFPNVLTTLPSVLPPRDIQTVDANFRNPFSLQGSIGLEQQFRFATISADYMYLNGRDLMSLVDANAPVSNVKPDQRTVAQADATRPISAVPGSFRNIVTLGNLGQSWYHALQVKAEHSSSSFQTIASYTLSRADDLDNYLLPEDSRNLDAEKARANADIRHNLSVTFTWLLPFERPLFRGLSVSGIGTFRSNRPYTISWGDDRNGTTQNDARPDGRNTAVTDSYSNVDLSFVRRFTYGRTAIEARVEVFNIFNTTNFDDYVGQLLSPFYAQPVSAFPKRRVQLAAVVRF